MPLERIGSTLVKGMGQRHQLRGFDRVEMPDLEDSWVGDVADYDALLAAAEGMEAIIHLTGVDSEWEKALSSNFIGTYNMLEAARIQGVRRVAYASRAGVHGSLPEDVMRHIDMRPQPVGHYTVSKLFGEHMGYSYSERHGLEFVAVRIGNFNIKRDQPEHPHHLSHGDAVRVFEQAVVHPGCATKSYTECRTALGRATTSTTGGAPLATIHRINRTGVPRRNKL